MAGWVKNDGQEPECIWVEVQYFNGPNGVVSLVRRTQEVIWDLSHSAPVICWREIEEPSLQEQEALRVEDLVLLSEAGLALPFV